MRFIRVRAGIFNPTVPDKVIEVDGIIDAGAIYTVIRRGIPKELDIKTK